VDAAVRIANTNNVLATPAGVTASDVTVDLSNRRVTVAAPRTAAAPAGIAVLTRRTLGGGVGDYISPSGTASSTSRSLTVAPVWDDCAQTINSGTNGQQVTVIGFVGVFVDSADSKGNVSGRLLNPMGCKGTGSGGGTGPLAAPIRLVQAPPAS
jgi:hypothetical protein